VNQLGKDKYHSSRMHCSDLEYFFFYFAFHFLWGKKWGRIMNNTTCRYGDLNFEKFRKSAVIFIWPTLCGLGCFLRDWNLLDSSEKFFTFEPFSFNQKFASSFVYYACSN